MSTPNQRLIVLPDRKDWGLLIWVVFIAFLFLAPYQRGASAIEWTLTALGAAVFVGLYFSVFVPRSRGRLRWIVSGDVLLGVVFAPFNAGAAIFFVYAASFVPFAFQDHTRTAVRIIAAIVAIVGLESWWLKLPPQFWGTAVAYSVLIGTANIWTAKQAITSERLRLAHDEIARLAKLAERERIARDLHDVLGHTLSVIILKAELGSKLLDHDLARARIEIAGVETVSREALSQVREAVRGYRAEGLQAEFERARTTLETAGVIVDCDPKPVALTSAQETVLALVLREAVTNVVRHARARHCSLRLAEVGRSAHLEVQDDGGGGLRLEGYGIRGMRERIEAFGGSLERQVGDGTRLIVMMPLENAGTAP